jgi:hypothetical protein
MAFIGFKIVVRAEITVSLQVSRHLITKQSPIFVKPRLREKRQVIMSTSVDTCALNFQN